MGYVLFIAFIALPLLEIAAFIQIGSLIGLWPTLAGIVLTALIGAVLVRHQGFKALRDARASARNNVAPVEPLIHGIFILVAGLLLLTPGFVTDAIGFTFLVPPLRLALAGIIWSWLRRNANLTVSAAGFERTARSHAPDPAHSDDATVIDLEAEEVTNPAHIGHTGKKQSPWKPKNGSADQV